jgi:hypothetical protein
MPKQDLKKFMNSTYHNSAEKFSNGILIGSGIEGLFEAS